MLLDDLHKNKDKINSLVSNYGGRRIRVFGSVSRREENSSSDIDFIVDLPRGYDLFNQRLALMYRLKKLLNRDVEVIPEHELNKHMRDRILDEAIDL